MRNQRYLRLFTIPLLFALVLLGGCKADVLNPKGYIGHEINTLIITAVGLMLIVVIPAIFMALYFPFKYREGRNAKYSPDWEFSAKIETLVWGVPIAIILVLGTLAWKYTHKVEPSKPIPTSVSTEKPITIQVVALKWKWLFIYPEQGIATVNQVIFPEKTPVSFKLTSDTTITSFFIPQLGSQLYTMAGMETKLHLIADGPGVYQGTAANFIGYGYSYMLFKAVAKSQTEFDNWVAAVKAGNAQDQVTGKTVATANLTMKAYDNLKDKRNENYMEPVAFYNLVPSDYSKDGLFEGIIEKYVPARSLGMSQHSASVGGH